MIKNLARKYNKEDYILIFNKFQKNFYLNYIKLIDSGLTVNDNCEVKQCWVFDRKESNPIYDLWLEQCKQHRQEIGLLIY